VLKNLSGFLPVIEGQQITEQPILLWNKGLFNKQAQVIIGTNGHEGNIFAFLDFGFDMNISYIKYVEGLKKELYGLSPDEMLHVIQWYSPIAEKQGYWHSFAAIVGDFFINCGSYIVSNILANNGSKNQVFRYLFSHPPSKWLFTYLNDTHAAEIPFVFYDEDILEAHFTPSETILSSQVVGYWTNFLATGNPNGKGLVDWLVYEGGRTADILDINLRISTTSEWMHDMCEKWKLLLLRDLIL